MNKKPLMKMVLTRMAYMRNINQHKIKNILDWLYTPG